MRRAIITPLNETTNDITTIVLNKSSFRSVLFLRGQSEVETRIRQALKPDRMYVAGIFYLLAGIYLDNNKCCSWRLPELSAEPGHKNFKPLILFRFLFFASLSKMAPGVFQTPRLNVD